MNPVNKITPEHVRKNPPPKGRIHVYSDPDHSDTDTYEVPGENAVINEEPTPPNKPR